MTTGCGAAAASDSARSGTLIGRAVFTKPGSHGVVKVLNASGRAVVRHDVRYPISHFRFALKPGRYEAELKLRGGSRWEGCPHERTVRVEASRTTHVTLGQGCVSTY